MLEAANILIFLLCLAVLNLSLSSIVFLISYSPYGQRFVHYRFFSLAVMLSYVLLYACSVLLSMLFPEWDDNGSAEMLAFPQHFSVALLYAPILQLVLVPASVGFSYLLRSMIYSKVRQ